MDLPHDSLSPSSEWQDALTAQLNARAGQRNTLIEGGESFGETENGQELQTCPPSPSEDGASQADQRPSTLTVPTTDPRPSLASPIAENALSAAAEISSGDQHRRQRRRIDNDNGARSPSNTSLSGRSQSPAQYACLPPHPALLSKRSPTSSSNKAHSVSPEAPEAEADDFSDGDSGSGEDELAVAVGQLSVNEDEQVRYHGKASGLHLLGSRQREDGRNEGGLW